MKKLLFILAICTYIIIPVFGTHTAHAQERREYTLLSPLPYTTTSGGLDNPKGEKTTFSTYLKGAYQLFFGIAGVLAVIMIVAGGFQYATTDAIQNKELGRERIKNAVLGLLLAFSTYIILYTISPGLLTFNLNVDRPVINLPPGGSPLDIEESERLARSQLGFYGLDTKVACKGTNTSDCVNLAGIPEFTFRELSVLEDDCNCELFITGGTEGEGVVHVTHGQGEPVVDLRLEPNLVSHVKTGVFEGNSAIGPIYSIGENQFIIENNHVHACIGQNCNVTYTCRSSESSCVAP